MSFDFGGAAPAPEPDRFGPPPRPTHNPPVPDWYQQNTPSDDADDLISAPWAWLALGYLAALIAIVAHLVLGGLGPAMAGWLLGGPVAIGCFAVFLQVDTGRRSEGTRYRESLVADAGRRLLVACSLVAIALNAWVIADHLARR